MGPDSPICLLALFWPLSQSSGEKGLHPSPKPAIGDLVSPTTYEPGRSTMPPDHPEELRKAAWKKKKEELIPWGINFEQWRAGPGTRDKFLTVTPHPQWLFQDVWFHLAFPDISVFFVSSGLLYNSWTCISFCSSSVSLSLNQFLEESSSPQ